MTWTTRRRRNNRRRYRTPRYPNNNKKRRSTCHDREKIRHRNVIRQHVVKHYTVQIGEILHDEEHVNFISSATNRLLRLLNEQRFVGRNLQRLERVINRLSLSIFGKLFHYLEGILFSGNNRLLRTYNRGTTRLIL